MSQRLDLKVLNEFVDKVFDEFDKDNRKKYLIEEVVRESIKENVDWFKRSFDLYEKILDQQTKTLQNSGYCQIVEVVAELVSKGTVGTASGPFNNVFEVGLSIDPILGLPYYPGSGIKGAVRTTFEELLEIECNVSNVETLSQLIFGSTGEVSWISSVTFLDAYPIGCKECSVFDKVLINPHYFKGGKVVDTELEVSPVPITFIGISPGLIFKFVFGVRESEELKRACKELAYSSCKCDNPCSSVTKLIAKSLVITLKTGLAAKAAKGYNVFEVFDSKAQQIPRSISLWKVSKASTHMKKSSSKAKPRSKRGGYYGKRYS